MVKDAKDVNFPHGNPVVDVVPSKYSAPHTRAQFIALFPGQGVFTQERKGAGHSTKIGIGNVMAKLFGTVIADLADVPPRRRA